MLNKMTHLITTAHCVGIMCLLAGCPLWTPPIDPAQFKCETDDDCVGDIPYRCGDNGTCIPIDARLPIPTINDAGALPDSGPQPDAGLKPDAGQNDAGSPPQDGWQLYELQSAWADPGP